jgi:molybdenum cofactor cytidylyltransferase
LDDPIIGLLLAAGASRRYGADKLAQPLPDGAPVAVRACRNLLAGTDGVLAVVRPGSERLAEQLRAEGAEVVVCPDADLGMGHSLAFGIRARPDAAGWLVALADMPWLSPATVRAVADALRTGAPIAAPCRDGRRGHPVGFARSFGPELAALTGDSGAKDLIQRNLPLLHLLECDDPGLFRDIDRPAELASFTPCTP